MFDITLIHPRSKFLIDEKVFAPLGILYLSSTLKLMGFSVSCIDRGLQMPLNINSKIVGISFTTAQKEEAYKLANLLKENHTLIAGGAHPSHMPQECLKSGFDFVIRGEADYQLPALLSRLNLSSEGIERILSNHEPQNLDILPFPDRSCLPIHSYHYLINDEPATTIMTSRSCPFSCSFCGRISDKFRMQSAYRTVDEIRFINENYGFKAFQIFDDVFIADKKRLKEIVWLLKGKDFIFRCFGRSNLLTPDICSLLKEMNVVEVGIGIESGSNTILKTNMKGTTVEQNTNAVKNLHDVGIRAKAFLIVGLPGETEQTISETEQWIKKAQPDDVDFSIFQPMPGSDIYRDPSKYNIQINYDVSSLFYKGTPSKYHGSSRTKELSEDRLIELRAYMESTYKKKELLR